MITSSLALGFYDVGQKLQTEFIMYGFKHVKENFF